MRIGTPDTSALLKPDNVLLIRKEERDQLVW